MIFHGHEHFQTESFNLKTCYKEKVYILYGREKNNKWYMKTNWCVKLHMNHIDTRA